MTCAAVAISPDGAAVNLRPRSTDASSPRRAAFLYPTWQIPPGDTRRPTRTRDVMPLPCRGSSCQAKSRHPRDSFRQAPHDSVCHFTNTHEAGAPVPPLSAMAGATFHSIPLAGCPASLPSLSFKTVNLAHALVSFVNSIRRGLETNRESLHEVTQGMSGGAKVMFKEA